MYVVVLRSCFDFLVGELLNNRLDHFSSWENEKKIGEGTRGGGKKEGGMMSNPSSKHIFILNSKTYLY